MGPLAVVKIGGSLLRDAEGLHRAAAAVADRWRHGESLLVVVSAFHGVTDLLERAAQQALDPRLNGGQPGLAAVEVRRRHEEIVRGLGDASRSRLHGSCAEVERLLAAISAAAALPESVYARLLSSGERLSMPLMVAALRARGLNARGITSEELGLRAIGPPRAGCCDLDASAPGLRKLRTELRERVVVLTGFYGLDHDGAVVLFGRGGSDDTAGAVAAGLEAGTLELWKDVPGFMSADPRHVGSARLVPELSFDEVAQLGEYGSRIVHHGCLEPLRGRPTEVRIGALGGAGSSGTRLVESRRGNGTRVVALMARRGRAEFLLRHRNGDGRGFSGRILAHLGEAGITVKTIATAPSSLRFTVRGPDAGRVETALRSLDDHRLAVGRFPALLGAVGDGVATEATIGARMLGRLTQLRIRGDLVVQGRGHAGLSCVVHDEDLLPALNGLHQLFFDGAG